MNLVEGPAEGARIALQCLQSVIHMRLQLAQPPHLLLLEAVKDDHFPLGRARAGQARDAGGEPRPVVHGLQRAVAGDGAGGGLVLPQVSGGVEGEAAAQGPVRVVQHRQHQLGQEEEHALHHEHGLVALVEGRGEGQERGHGRGQQPGKGHLVEHRVEGHLLGELPLRRPGRVLEPGAGAQAQQQQEQAGVRVVEVQRGVGVREAVVPDRAHQRREAVQRPEHRQLHAPADGDLGPHDRPPLGQQHQQQHQQCVRQPEEDAAARERARVPVPLPGHRPVVGHAQDEPQPGQRDAAQQQPGRVVVAPLGDEFAAHPQREAPQEGREDPEHNLCVHEPNLLKTEMFFRSSQSISKLKVVLNIRKRPLTKVIAFIIA